MKRTSMIWQLLLVLCVALAFLGGVGSDAVAAPQVLGELDQSFGVGGRVVTNFSGSTDWLAKLAVQADGKIVAAGYTCDFSFSCPNSPAIFTLKRYNADGSLDQGFIVRGTGSIAALALQPDGKIMVGELAPPVLARYNPDGSPDVSFAEDGYIERLAAEGIAFQPDGKIIVMSATSITRLAADGTPDPHFGTGGTMTFGSFWTENSYAHAIAVQPDGKIVFAGWLNGYGFAVSRLNGDGSFDSSFGTAGLAAITFAPGAILSLNALALQSDGKIVAAGGTGADFALARLDSNGNLDASFAGAGKVTTDFSGNTDEVRSLLIQPDGKIVTAGGPGFKLARYLTDGSLDTSFDSDGKVFTALEQATSIALTASGKLIAGGYSAGDYALAQYNPNGTLDGSFGQVGKVFSDMIGSEDVPVASVVQPDGKIVVAGSSNGPFAQTRYDLARYLPDGNLDPAFGQGGLVTSDWGVSAAALARQPDSKLLLLGATDTGDFALARYLPNGSLDTTFGNGGKTTYGFPDGYHDAGTALALQTDGKILAAGQGSASDCDDAGCYPCMRCFPVVLRFDAAGGLDTSFADNGVLRTPYYINAIVVQPDNKWLIAGTSNRNFAVTRYLGNGTADLSFGSSGTVVTDFAGNDDSIYDLALQPDGKIVAAGGPGFKLVRYLADGRLDRGFGVAGKVYTPLEQASKLALGANGQIAVAGFDSNDVALALYNGAGAIVPNFGPDGALHLDFGMVDGRGPRDRPAGLSFDAVGRLVLAAPANAVYQLTRADFALARLTTLPYGDVTQANTFYTYIQNLWYHGIIDGYDDNTFHPFQDSSRADLTRWVVKARGWAIDTSGGPHFSDVPTSHPDYRYVETAFKHGVISGYAPADCPGGTAACFKPGNPLTRGQMSKMIVNAFGWPSNTTGGPHFRDVRPNNPFYAQIETIYRRGVVSGYDVAGGGFEFRWGNNLTRGQLTKVLSLALDGVPAARAQK